MTRVATRENVARAEKADRRAHNAEAGKKGLSR